MILWGVSRIVKFGAELCGADSAAANGLAIATCSVLLPLDPIGGAAGLAHGCAGAAAAEGSETAKNIDKAMSIGALLIGMSDGGVGGDSSPPTDQGNMA